MPKIHAQVAGAEAQRARGEVVLEQVVQEEREEVESDNFGRVRRLEGEYVELRVQVCHDPGGFVVPAARYARKRWEPDAIYRVVGLAGLSTNKLQSRHRR
jgi:hypothetical protein